METQFTFYWTNLSFQTQAWEFSTLGNSTQIQAGNTVEEQLSFSDGDTITVTVDDAATAQLTLNGGVWYVEAPEHFTHSQLEQIFTLSCNYSVGPSE